MSQSGRYETFDRTSKVIQQGYYCFFCDRIYRTLNPLKEHFKDHNILTSFKYIELWPRREPKFFEQDFFECVLCRYQREIFRDNDDGMNTHLDTVHQNTIKTSNVRAEKINSIEPIQPISSCSTCLKGYTSYKMLLLHVKAVHKVTQTQTNESLISMPSPFDNKLQKQFRCNVCLYVFVTYTDLQLHFYLMHQSHILNYTLILSQLNGYVDYVEQEDKLLFCVPCRKEFGRDMYDLLCHLADQHLSQPKYSYSLSQDGFVIKYNGRISL